MSQFLFRCVGSCVVATYFSQVLLTKPLIMPYVQTDLYGLYIIMYKQIDIIFI